MRLGIVGMLPGDFRTHTDKHFEAIAQSGFTGAGFHFPGHLTGEIRLSDIEQSRPLFADTRRTLPNSQSPTPSACSIQNLTRAPQSCPPSSIRLTWPPPCPQSSI